MSIQSTDVLPDKKTKTFVEKTKSFSWRILMIFLFIKWFFFAGPITFNRISRDMAEATGDLIVEIPLATAYISSGPIGAICISTFFCSSVKAIHHNGKIQEHNNKIQHFQNQFQVESFSDAK